MTEKDFEITMTSALKNMLAKIEEIKALRKSWIELNEYDSEKKLITFLASAQVLTGFIEGYYTTRNPLENIFRDLEIQYKELYEVLDVRKIFKRGSIVYYNDKFLKINKIIFNKEDTTTFLIDAKIRIYCESFYCYVSSFGNTSNFYYSSGIEAVAAGDIGTLKILEGEDLIKAKKLLSRARKLSKETFEFKPAESKTNSLVKMRMLLNQ